MQDGINVSVDWPTYLKFIQIRLVPMTQHLEINAASFYKNNNRNNPTPKHQNSSTKVKTESK